MAEGGGNEGRHAVPPKGDENVLKLDCGNGCATLSV